ncbi:MAG: CPBP family intramembrane metalloprotease [Deltaproteobacteria bacterium]|nr:CPBP family intramembrane metalloprotease [Deltaproteobacteria bacterium]
MCPDDTKRHAREALYASAALIALLGLLKQFAAGELAQKIGFTIAAAFQLYLPLWLLSRHGQRARDYGLHMHGSVGAPLALLRRRCLVAARGRERGRPGRRALLKLSYLLAPYAHRARFEPTTFWHDLRQTGLLIAVTFPPFAVGHHFWQLWLAHHAHRHAHYAFHLPADLTELLLINLLLVALPEELFYRGFVQTRLLAAWPPWLTRFGVPVGWAILVSSALFALGHYAGEWGNPARLGPFFPALLFAAMRARSGSIMGAVIYHGLSNVFSETLRSGYTFS